MKASLVVLLGGICTLAASGCASTGASVNAQSQAGASNHKHQIDAGYVAAVERQARDRGVKVRWIHPPIKSL